MTKTRHRSPSKTRYHKTAMKTGTYRPVCRYCLQYFRWNQVNGRWRPWEIKEDLPHVCTTT